MFYALGSVGAFTQGARKRRNEIRSERAAIRDEFERWKANNPNATAMDFHAKVKQLGATTPGGSVALPDASSIQRMAAENLRRKQQEEADRARKLRVDNMNMQLTENTLARQLLTDAPDMSASDLLSSMNLPTTATTLAWAEGIQKSEKRKLEQATAQGKLREQAQQFEQNKAIANWAQQERRLNPLLTDQEIRDRGESQFGPIYNTAVSTPSRGSPVASAPPAYGPVQQAPATQSVGVDDEAVRLITGQLDARLATAKTSAEVQATVQAVAQEASNAGRTSEEIRASLANSTVYEGRIKAFRTQSFDQILDNAQDIPNLTIVVRGKGNTQPINLSLEEMSNSAFNNTRFVEDAYIPPSAENYVADRLSTYFTINKGGSPTLIDDIAAMEPSARVNYIMKDLEQFGVVAKADVRQAREATLAAAPDITSVQQYVDILDGDDVGSYPVKRDLAKIEAEADNTTQAEREAAKQVLLNTIDTHARIFASGDTVSIYSAGFADIRDLLPPGADADMAPLEQWFKDTRKLIEEFDTSKGGVTPVNQPEFVASQQSAATFDVAMSAMAQPMSSPEKDVLMEVLQQQGYANKLDNLAIAQVRDGATEFVSPIGAGDLYGALEGANGQAIAQAIKASLAAYENYEFMPVDRGNILTVAGGFIHDKMTEENKRLKAGTDAAKIVLEANGISEFTEILNLIADQILRGSGITGTPTRMLMADAFNQIKTVPTNQGLPPGAEFVIPN